MIYVLVILGVWIIMGTIGHVFGKLHDIIICKYPWRIMLPDLQWAIIFGPVSLYICLRTWIKWIGERF